MVGVAIGCGISLSVTGTTVAYRHAYYGLGTGPVLLSGLFCRGSEVAILECPRYYSIGATTCSHQQDVGVACAMA